MNRRAFLSISAGAIALSSCGGRQPSRPAVDLIVLEKHKRKMTLFRQGKAIKQYDVGLGFTPVGHKQFEGDGRTPEGSYQIWTKNPRSSFYLSLGISYPNINDVQYARARGMSPGGDIFIHGESRNPLEMDSRDWTAGCIAVTNEEIREIYSLVGVGTRIDILP